ncbi:MAG: hypothetical protein ACYDH3_02095 [Candidatus Aminicenantales bacterium]
MFPVLVFAASFAAFDRLLMLGFKASASHYYASLDTGDFNSNKTIIFGQGDGDILIFGSSRAGRAFGENQLSALLNKRVIKDANAGRFPRFFYYYYLKYRSNHARPAAVFYGTDYFMFEKTTSPKDLAALDKTIKLDVLNPSGSVNEASAFLSRVSWLFRKKPEIDNYLGDRLKLERDAEAGDLTAGETKESPQAGKRRKRPKPVRSQHPRTYQAYPGIEGDYLQKLLALLEEDGVPVFIVFIPDYAGTNQINFEQKKFKADVGALARPYKNASVLDFNRPDRFDLNNPSLFREGAESRSNCHLSFEGRKRFTVKLIDAVRPLLAREAAPDGTKRKPKP